MKRKGKQSAKKKNRVQKRQIENQRKCICVKMNIIMRYRKITTYLFFFLKGNNNRSVTTITKHNGYKALVTNLVENETFFDNLLIRR